MTRKPYQLPFHRSYNWQLWFHQHLHKIVMVIVAVCLAAAVALFIGYLMLQDEAAAANVKMIELKTEISKTAIDLRNLFYFGAPKEGEEKIVLTWKGKKIDY